MTREAQANGDVAAAFWSVAVGVGCWQCTAVLCCISKPWSHNFRAVQPEVLASVSDAPRVSFCTFMHLQGKWWIFSTWGGGSVGYKLVLSSFLILPLQVMLFNNGQQLPFPQVHSVLLSKDVPCEKHPPVVS